MAESDADPSRRAVLSGTGAVLASALAGCSAREVTGGRPPDGQAASLLAAGSLNDAVENGLKPALREKGTTLRVEARGSAEAARLVAEGRKDPDIVSVADPALFDGPLDPPWHAEFATNAVVLAYDADSAGGRALADADRWYRPLLDGAVSLGRTDPDLDPLGYRTLFVLDLATDFYDLDTDLREAIPAREQVYPETQLVSQFETGSVDAAFTYRSMTVERGYEFVALPPAIDLSDPARADSYREASYDLPSGKTVRGDLVSYATAMRADTDVARDAFEEHTTGDYLTEFGFGVPDDYPRFEGDVPDDF